jgi:gamma-glutamyltranspeptidase/glutathione hydrolase/leukotriene-C4 hydrolase
MSKAQSADMRAKISDTATNHTPEFYGGEFDVQDTPGTTHLSVVGPDGDAVSVTSTINLNFGSKLMTEDGIILNNQVSVCVSVSV